MQLEPYLFFHGRCEEALNFYKECLGAEITELDRFAGSPIESEVSDDVKFMASDGRPGSRSRRRDDIALSLATGDATEGERVFKALAEGGTVSMPFADRFWGGKFGSVTDRFGVQWMISAR